MEDYQIKKINNTAEALDAVISLATGIPSNVPLTDEQLERMRSTLGGGEEYTAEEVERMFDDIGDIEDYGGNTCLVLNIPVDSNFNLLISQDEMQMIYEKVKSGRYVSILTKQGYYPMTYYQRGVDKEKEDGICTKDITFFNNFNMLLVSDIDTGEWNVTKIG